MTFSRPYAWPVSHCPFIITNLMHYYYVAYSVYYGLNFVKRSYIKYVFILFTIYILHDMHLDMFKEHDKNSLQQK